VRREERGETATQHPLALQHGSDGEQERGTNLLTCGKNKKDFIAGVACLDIEAAGQV
jgi:hypothetical protein